MSTEKKPVVEKKVGTCQTVSIYAKAEYRAWLLDLANSERVPISVLVDRLVREHAKAVGFRPAPKRGVR